MSEHIERGALLQHLSCNPKIRFIKVSDTGGFWIDGNDTCDVIRDFPAAIPAEQDRRELCAVLAANGLEVRIVRVKTTTRGTPKRYVEYRLGPVKDLLEIAVNEFADQP